MQVPEVIHHLEVLGQEIGREPVYRGRQRPKGVRLAGPSLRRWLDRSSQVIQHCLTCAENLIEISQEDTWVSGNEPQDGRAHRYDMDTWANWENARTTALGVLEVAGPTALAHVLRDLDRRSIENARFLARIQEAARQGMDLEEALHQALEASTWPGHKCKPPLGIDGEEDDGVLFRRGVEAAVKHFSRYREWHFAMAPEQPWCLHFGVELQRWVRMAASERGLIYCPMARYRDSRRKHYTVLSTLDGGPVLVHHAGVYACLLAACRSGVELPPGFPWECWEDLRNEVVTHVAIAMWHEQHHHQAVDTSGLYGKEEEDDATDPWDRRPS